MKNQKRHILPSIASGFTLIELVVVLSIAGIITSFAVPSFSTMIKNNRVAYQANDLLSAVNLARSEAIKRGQRMTVCPRKSPRTAPESCSNSTNWGTGVLVFSDVTGTTGVFDSTDTLLRVLDTFSGLPSVTGSATTLQYFPSGDAVSSLTITLKITGCSGNQSREIAVNLTGRGKINHISC